MSVILNLETLVRAMTDHAIIGTALATEEHWLIRDAFVNYAIRKHSLVRDTKDECSESRIISWLAFFPHF